MLGPATVSQASWLSSLVEALSPLSRAGTYNALDTFVLQLYQHLTTTP